MLRLLDDDFEDEELECLEWCWPLRSLRCLLLSPDACASPAIFAAISISFLSSPPPPAKADSIKTHDSVPMRTHAMRLLHEYDIHQVVKRT